MKTLKFLACSSLLILNSSLSSGQSWMWGRQSSGSLKTNDNGSPVATDKNGNAYITGQYANVITFGSITLTGNSENAYLVKYNAEGNAVWVKQSDNSGTSYSYGTSVATDEEGNVFIAGMFSGSITFGTVILSAYYSDYDVFLVKYDADGNVLWAKQSNSTSTYYYGSSAYSVATDKSGNVFITGIFEGGITLGSFTLQTLYGEDVFLAKYDAGGNVLWAEQSTNRTIYSNSAGIENTCVTTDNSGNSLVAGGFADTLSFGSYLLAGGSVINQPSVFLVKYSPEGNVLWAKQSVNGSAGSSGEGFSVVCDQAGYPYITGDFLGVVKFDSYSLYSPFVNSAFLTKYDVDGNVLWAKQSSQGWAGYYLASDELYHIYLSGGFYYQNPDSLKFGKYSLAVNPWATAATYIVEFNSEGQALCGSILDNLGNYGQKSGVAASLYGDYVYMAGTFLNDTVICGRDTLMSRNGGANVFVGSWHSCYSSPPPTEAGSEPCGSLFVPNVFSPNGDGHNDILYVRSSCTNSIDFLVFDRWGNKVFETENINKGWDGTYKGMPENSGTFVWYLKANLLDGTNIEKSGNVALVR